MNYCDSAQEFWQDSSVFLCNFLAIIPLAWIIGKSTEDLSSAVGQTMGGLLNASFGTLPGRMLDDVGCDQDDRIGVA